MSDASLHLSTMHDLGYINLRGASRDKAFLDAVKAATGLLLPLVPNTVVQGEHEACWLGPNEWALLTAPEKSRPTVRALIEALHGQHAAINDLSGGQVTFRLNGAKACNLLAKGCALDLHPGAFTSGMCAQTGLAKASVILKPLESGSGFDVLVRRSFADYLAQWLLRAGREYGIEVN